MLDDSGAPMLLVIPFAVFFLCCVGQFWFMKRVRDRLIDHHPDAYLRIERASFFPGNAIYRLAWRRHPALPDNDEELNRRLFHLRLLWVVAIWPGFRSRAE